MSEDPRRQLAQRLDAKNNPIVENARLYGINSMQKSKSQALIPMLSSVSTKSLATLPMPRKLNPISPFLKTGNIVLPKIKPVEPLELPVSKSVLKQKILPPLPNANSKQKKRHYHGDVKLLIEGVKEENVTPYNFIQTIKFAPEYIEDFWYCNRKGDAYDYEFVKFNEKNEEYMTISSRGITHFTPGGAYFLSLDEWEREYKLYQKLKEISFFKQYKKWKNFSLWKNLRRRNMMDERSQFLEAELFILDEKLRDPLLDLRAKSWEILRFDLFDISFDKVRTIEEFNIEQDRKRTEGAKELQELEIEIKRDVANSCRNSLEAFRRENKTTANNDDANKGPEDDADPFLVGDMSNKQMPYTQEAIIRTHYKRLAKFVRLCDYQIIDAKVTLSYQSNLKIKSAINYDYYSKDKKPLLRRQNQPLFVIKANFQERSLDFDPTNENIKKAIYDATIRGLTILLNNYMLASAPEFEKYSRALEEYEEKQTEEEFDLLQMIVNDDNIKSIQAQVKEGIDTSFARLVEKASTVLPLIETYHRNNRLNVQNLEDEDIEVIKHLILDYKEQEERFKGLKEVEDIGIFQLNIENIKNILLPSPTSCLKKIETYLPQIAFESASKLTATLSQFNTNLKGYPKKVEEYVKIVKHIKEIEEKLQDITSKVNDLKDLMQLLEAFTIRIEDHIKRKYNETLSALDALRQRMQSFYERAESDKIRFTRELRDKIINVDKRTAELKLRLAVDTIANKDSPTSAMLDLLSSIGEEVSVLIVDTKNFNSYQQELEIEPKNFVDVFELHKDFQRKYDMWKALHEWQDKVVGWNDTAFSVIDVTKISTEVDRYHKIAKKSKILEEQGNYVPQILRAKVETLKDTMPVVVDLRCVSLKERHWEAIRKELKLEANINDPKFTLKNLLDLKVNNVKDKIAEIALRARKEEEIERQLDEVVSSWEEYEFSFKYTKDGDYYLFTNVDEIVSKLEETQVTLTTLLTNRFLGPLFEKVDLWSKKFKLFATTFDEWLLCQKQWGELDKIFKNGDIAKKLKEKSKKFQQIDGAFREKMKITSLSNSKALVACTKDGLLKVLQEWNKNLEKLQKNLEDYLDKERIQFNRFFFLSNEELLMILSNSQNIALIQPHLKNMFEGIYELEFDKSKPDPSEKSKPDTIIAIVSAEKERLLISTQLKAKGFVEDWLKNLETAMVTNLKTAMTEANSQDVGRKDLVMTYPSQVVLTTCMVQWVSAIEDAFSSRDTVLEMLGDLGETTNTYLEELTQTVREDLDLYVRRRVISLVTQDVHNRDTIEWLKDEEVVSVNEFKWQQQLRYYWEPSTTSYDCTIKQINASFPYGYEYLGATTRLVITALTDRCWMTITGALKINLGASPAGPAGTGKTESTKDLAKAMGRYCIVFNCSEQITYTMMEKLFMGLCYTGSWACLDEFNRIDIEVLSVIAQQLRVIKHAKDEDKPEFFFEDKKTLMKNTMGVFITMNPNYVGRTELPDNLKVMFRPISMMIPDYTLIAEVMLYAEGFQIAKHLSVKMTKLYKLASEQLSQQDHYDFGMRAVKSVLNMAGALKRKEPHLAEEEVLIRAMKDSNVPKFLKEDLVLFNAIISDLFPEAVVTQADYGELEACVRECIQREKLRNIDTFVTKVIQLYETLEVRIGVMIIGPATAGKSTCYRVLAKTLTELRANNSRNQNFQKVIFQVINPKAISMGELYGEYNDTTQDWKDGLASFIIREFCTKDEPTRRWVVFDGPVDSLWIENMNTVLDDNMMLCLANQERIKLKPEMRMLFEVGDLTSASPATVSRCGMVYMNMEAVGWKAILETLLIKQLVDWNEKYVDYLFFLINQYFAKALKILRKNLHEPISTSNNSVVISFCSLLKAVTSPEVCPRLNDSFDYFKKYLEKVFVFCITWGIGGGLDSHGQKIFDQALSTELGIDLPKGTLFESFVSPYKIGGEYKQWESIKPEFVFKPNISYFRLLVPTLDTIRFQQMLKYSISIQKPIFITGNTGVGKSVIIYNSLISFKETDRVAPIFITFSAQTSSQQTQNSIVGKLNPIKKDILGGYGNNRVALMIDDVNMPTVERYGSQPPIELLRHFCDHGMIYDREKQFAMRIIDTTLICCAAPPGGGRSALTQRFTRHFHMVTIPDTSDESMNLIFRTILEGFYQNGFKQEIQHMASSVVSATIGIYQALKSELLPTPSKSHYLFNLRDISKVFQGMLMTKPLNMGNTDAMVRLWIHEALRVFYDRLTNRQDKMWLGEIIIKAVLQYFKLSYSYEELLGGTPIIFVDFLRGDQDVDEREYIEVKDISFLSKRIYEILDDYNIQNSRPMELVFFNDAIEHLSRICRILRQQRGNCMLIGVGGCGKQSLTRLASFISSCECFQIQVTKDYSHTSFHNDIKKLFMLTGGTNPKPTLFLMTDTQIIKEDFLEDINNILNSGEVPNLFTKEEIDGIEQDLRPIAEREKISDNYFNYFIQRVRANLHIVMCMSPIGDALRVRMRMFPSLVNCCTIDWVNPWPTDALLSVSKNKLLEMPTDTMTRVEATRNRELISHMCVYVHESVLEAADEFSQVLNRKVYVTPKSYLDMVSCFFKILQEKQDELNSGRMRYKTGVEQLVKTNKEVAEMQKMLITLAPELEQKRTESEELEKTVDIDREKANQAKEKAEEEEREVNTKTNEVKSLQEDAENELRVAIPILDSAVKALQNIDRKQIGEIRTFAAPPELVAYTLEAIAILMEVPTNMESIRKLLQNNFLESLMSFKRDNIKPVTLKKLRNKISSNPNFLPEKVEVQNIASKSLCQWVFAIENYARISSEVEPKRKRLEEMNKALVEATSKLLATQEKLKAELDTVTRLEFKLKSIIDELNRLNNEIQITNTRCQRASVLTEGLKEEHKRWEVALEKISEQLTHILGNTFIAAASVSYYGPFTGSYRRKLVSSWVAKCRELEIPVSNHFELQDVLGDPIQIRQWNVDTLPNDSISINNAIIITRSERWPLMIDPQEQANRWIRKMEEGKIKIVKQTDKDFGRNLETCLRDGYPLLIEDVGEVISPMLDPVLSKNLVEQSPGRYTLRIGETEIEYDSKFKLYITTKLPNPHYLPEISIKVSLINFTVTMQGLEEQLLGDVVRKEEPKIEERQNKLIKDISEGQKELNSSEQMILMSLSATTGNILDDAKLITKLDSSKKHSDMINKRMANSEKTKIENEVAREKYKSVARRGSILYFVIADLANIDPMYQYSLSYFSKLFKLILDSAPHPATLEERIEILIKAVTEVIFSNVCRGLFNSHKLIFSFLISSQILRDQGEIEDQEWSFLLKWASINLSSFVKTPNPKPAVFSEKAWNSVMYLQNSSKPFMEPLLGEQISADLQAWEAWINLQEPHLHEPPGRYSSLSSFHKLLIIKALREEKIIYTITKFIKEVLGERFIKTPPVSMEELFAETTKRTPIIFILSQGADPMAMVQRLAKDKKCPEKIDAISLGKGQEEKAKKAVEKGMREGKWVILQNCHLAKSWLPDLEKIIESFDDPKTVIADEFRIYLSSMPCSYFPIPVLQNGVKLTIEPPKGIQSNLLKSFNMLTDERMGSTNKPEVWKRVIFSLCMFHAVVQERRKFGPLGWNLRYEFNDSDLDASMKIIENFLNENEVVPWDAIRFVIGEINYGGRVTDDLDRRCLNSVLLSFLHTRVLTSGYQFMDSGVYYVPEVFSLDYLKEYASALPIADDPDIFGMHENANISFQRSESSYILSTALSIQPKEKGITGLGKTADQIVDELASKFLEELPSILMKSEERVPIFVEDSNGLMDAMATFLSQEMERFNKLLYRIRSSLEDLKNAIKGIVLMSDDLDKMYTSINENRIPAIWSKVAYPSLKPLASWLNDLRNRVRFLREWLAVGKPNAYWLGAFFFPQGFLTAVLQTHSRKFKMPIDTLNFFFDFQAVGSVAEIEERTEEGVLIYGLYMEGCRWDTEALQLEDSRPGEMHSEAPPIIFSPSDTNSPEAEDYLMPVYKTSDRAGLLSTTGQSTNYIISIECPSSKKPLYWILRGAAFLCQLND